MSSKNLKTALILCPQKNTLKTHPQNIFYTSLAQKVPDIFGENFLCPLYTSLQQKVPDIWGIN